MLTIIGIILFGAILLVLEIVLLPGLIVGIIGSIIMIFGLALMYKNHGTVAGHISLLTTAISTGGFLWWAFTSKAWDRFSLNTVNKAKAIDYLQQEVKEGDIATTISAMRPMGTVLINDKKYEAQSQISFIDVGKKVMVIEVLPNKLVVKEV